MNRPLALIQGNLALPNARLLRGLPPPYGVYRWTARAATQRRSKSAVQDTARRTSQQAPNTWSTPGQKFRLFYKAAAPRDHSSRVTEELAEARNYLEMDRARERSSRSDRALGATIFIACSIVLAWLLMSSAAHDTDKSATVAIASTVVATTGASVAVHPQQALAKPAQPTVAKLASAPANPAPKTARRSEPKPSSIQAMLPAKPALPARHTEPHRSVRASTYETASSRATTHKAEARIKATVTATADSKIAAAHPTEAQAFERQVSGDSLPRATSFAVSTQPDQTARSSADATNAINASAALRDWAAQQRRATTRATATANTTTSTDWNTHITQHRITDNPTAFEAFSAQH